MPAQKPEEVHRLFEQAFNAGDLDALMALYEPAASLIPTPGQLVSGTEAVRAALAGYLAVKGRLAIETHRIVPAGDVALMYGRWTLTGTGPDGAPITMGGRNTEVVRRQPDGGWRYVVDDPFGEA